MEIPMESKKLKEVREELGLTQSAFATQLGIKNTTADIERGRTKISGFVVMQLLKTYHINPLWLYGYSAQKHLNPDHQYVNPKMISVDNVGNENILLVHEKAAAGYAGNIGDPEYYDDLPAFTFPLPEYRNASFRGFQVDGQSMQPALLPGEWIIAKAISNINEIQNGNIYVVVEKEGIRVKKLVVNSDNQSISLISTNPDYPADIISYDDVKELWEFHSKITQEVSTQLPQTQLDQIQQDLKTLSQAIHNLNAIK